MVLSIKGKEGARSKTNPPTKAWVSPGSCSENHSTLFKIKVPTIDNQEF